ncbi:MAG: chemotaxis protein CheW [Gemmatimonadaceae bacterium]
MSAPANVLRQYCTFTLNGLLFGIDVSTVQEVIRFQEMTEVPLAHRVVKGLINLRGQIVTALDLRRRLDLPERAADEQPMNIVVRMEDGAVSFLVDDIGDVVEVDGSLFERPPETLRGTARSLILGAHKLDKRLLLVLDTTRAAHLKDDVSEDRVM